MFFNTNCAKQDQWQLTLLRAAVYYVTDGHLQWPLTTLILDICASQ